MADSFIYTVLNLLAFQSDPVWLSILLYIGGLLQVAFIATLVFSPLKERLAKAKSEPPKESAKSSPAADGQQKPDGEKKAGPVAAVCKTSFCSNLLQSFKKSKKNKEKKKKR